MYCLSMFGLCVVCSGLYHIMSNVCTWISPMVLRQTLEECMCLLVVLFDSCSTLPLGQLIYNATDNTLLSHFKQKGQRHWSSELDCPNRRQLLKDLLRGTWSLRLSAMIGSHLIEGASHDEVFKYWLQLIEFGAPENLVSNVKCFQTMIKDKECKQKASVICKYALIWVKNSANTLYQHHVGVVKKEYSGITLVTHPKRSHNLTLTRHVRSFWIYSKVHFNNSAAVCKFSNSYSGDKLSCCVSSSMG